MSTNKPPIDPRPADVQIPSLLLAQFGLWSTGLLLLCWWIWA
jgi:hypothetical protein